MACDGQKRPVEIPQISARCFMGNPSSETKNMPSVHRFSIFADYFQFIVQDENSEDDFGTIWTEEALNCMVAVGETAICPGTLRNVDVPVEVHVLGAEPAVLLEGYDHIVEGAFRSPTGRLVVMGCTEYFPDAPRFEIAPGSYRFLYLISGVQTITAEWEPAEDLYCLYIWPGEARSPRLLKHW
jgi:hypothetical protein